MDEDLNRPISAPDVEHAYAVLLGRLPESAIVTGAKASLTRKELIAELIGAEEFRERISDPTSEGRLLQGGLFDSAPDRVMLQWAADFLPLGLDTRRGLVAETSWYGLYAAVFGDVEFRRVLSDVAPRLLDPAFLKGVRALSAGLGDRLIIGGLEAVSPGRVSGWALNRNAVDERVGVEARVSGVFVSAGLTGRLRRDLQDIYGGQGRFGFELTGLPAPNADAAGVVEVEVCETASGALIGRLPLRPRRAEEADHLRQLRQDLAGVKATVARLELAFNAAAAGLGHYLPDYDDYFRAIYARTPLVEAAEQRAQDAFVRRPLISVALLLEPERMQELGSSLESLAAQTYPHCELLLASTAGLALEQADHALQRARSAVGDRVRLLADPEAAPAAVKGEYLVFLRAGDELSPNALQSVAAELQGDARPALVYADEDAIVQTPNGVRYAAPRLKPDFDPDLQLQTGYIGDLLALSVAALRQAAAQGGGMAAAARYDLILRVIEAAKPDPIAHIARVLYQARSELRREDGEASASDLSRAAQAHFQRTGLAADVLAHTDEVGATVQGAVRLRPQRNLDDVRVAVIIPTRDRLDLIGPCVASLLAASTHNRANLEIIVVDNGGSLEAGRAFLGSLAASRQVRLISDEAPFNWGALNNGAARLTDAEVLIFQNDDTVVLTRDGLDELCRQALRPEVGAVGARLLYEDGSIQHAGVVLGGANGVAFHEGLGLAGDDAGYLGRHALLHRASAVTGACLATRADVFRRLGGFDQHGFTVEAGDIDYCLRVQQAGLAVLYDPYVTLYHFESKTRGQTGADARRTESAARELDKLRSRWGERLARDPYYNPHFDRFSRPFVKLGPPR